MKISISWRDFDARRRKVQKISVDEMSAPTVIASAAGVLEYAINSSETARLILSSQLLESLIY